MSVGGATTKRLVVTMILGAATFGVLHELGRRWGATSDEVARDMPGDDIVPRARCRRRMGSRSTSDQSRCGPGSSRLGYHRAGWYTYPWVDRYLWRIPSADQIVSALQDLVVGDIVPDGEPGTAFYRVDVLKPPSLMVLHSTSHVPQQLKDRMRLDWTWTFELRPVGSTRTRLLLRVRGTLEPLWARLVYEGLVVPSDFLMARSMLRGIARRAEGHLTWGDRRDAARREHRAAGATETG